MTSNLGKGVAALIVLAALCGTLAFASLWADRQLLQTDRWTETSTELLERPAVRDALSAYLVDQLFTNVDVSGQLRQSLPTQLKGLSAPAASGLRELAGRTADKALENPRVQQLWESANRVAHARLMTILDGGEGAISTAGGVVKLDTKQMLQDLAAQTGIGQKLVTKLPPGAGEIVVMRSDQLRTAQNAARAVHAFAVVFTILTVLFAVTAIWLARGRRRWALAWTGGAFVAVGVLVLLLVGILKTPLVDSLAATASVRPAVSDVFDVSTSLLREQAASIIVAGLLIMAAAWLGGPSRVAVGFRRAAAPFLRDYLAASAIVVALAFLLVVWWSPTLGFRTLTGLTINLLLVVAGFIALARITRREFPGAAVADQTLDKDEFET
ncbi:MAG: hypothetical protein JJE27_00100 [Thermoleophilia bacterium]|nr:hypothetical protein [Thermoleophilia bacterium]